MFRESFFFVDSQVYSAQNNPYTTVAHSEPEQNQHTLKGLQERRLLNRRVGLNKTNHAKRCLGGYSF